MGRVDILMIFEPSNPLIYLALLWFLSVVFCSFYHTDCPFFVRFICRHFIFGAIINDTFKRFPFPIFIANIQIYVRLFLYVTVYLEHLLSSCLSSRSFFWKLDFLCRSRIPWIETVLHLSFLHVCLLFLLLLALLCSLELLVLCWIRVRRAILFDSFLILGEKI